MADREQALQLTTTETSDEVVVALHGELDPHTVPTLQECLDQHAADPRTVVLDLGDLRFIDSAGLRVIIGAFKALDARGSNLVIRRPTETATRLFEITGLDAILTIE